MPITMTFRDPFLVSLQPRLRAIEPRTQAAIAGISPAAFVEAPPWGGWSIAQVFEHMCLANESYIVPITRAIEEAKRRGAEPRPHRSTLFGGMLASRLAETSTAKLPAPRPYRPLLPRANVVPSFLATMHWTEERMLEADGHDLRVMLSSPVAWFVRMNLAEAFALGVIHAERHLNQVERTRRAIGA
jgi:hypothetical protein